MAPSSRGGCAGGHRRERTPFPAGLRKRLLSSNGGDAFVGEEGWTLFPVWDPGTKASTRRSAGHVSRETAGLYEALGAALPPDMETD